MKNAPCECTVTAGAASTVHIQIRVFPEAVLGPGNPGAQSVPLRPPANQQTPPIAYDGSSISAFARAQSLYVIGWKEGRGG